MDNKSLLKQFNALSLLALTLMLVIITALVTLISDNILSIPFVSYLYSIPVFFLVSGLIMLLIINKTDKKNDKKLVRVFMLVKTIKNVTTVIAGLICILGAGVSFKHFIIIAGIFYLFYLAYETIVLFRFEKLIKNLNE